MGEKEEEQIQLAELYLVQDRKGGRHVKEGERCHHLIKFHVCKMIIPSISQRISIQ